MNQNSRRNYLPRPQWFALATVGLALGTVNLPFHISDSSQHSLIRNVFADEVSSSKRGSRDLRDGSPATAKQVREIEELIDALASKNKAPVQRGKGGHLRLEYSTDYDKSADEAVEAAGDKLIGYGTAAFPMLFEHFEDQRFSHVTETSGGDTTAPVGSACRSIIECQLEVYRKIGIYPRMVPSYFWDVVDKDEKPDEWWKSHKMMSLQEIQIEGVEWAISQQKGILRAGNYRGDNFNKERLAEIITRNESTLEMLRKTKKPIAAKRTFPRILK